MNIDKANNELVSIPSYDPNKLIENTEEYRKFMRYDFQYPYWDTMPKIEVNGKQQFINASWVNGIKKEKVYIATQSPLRNTIDHFWRMVSDNDVNLIVMLTDYVEKGVRKAEYYWNNFIDMPYNSGTIITNMITRETKGDFIYSTIEVSDVKTDVTRTIVHITFTGWPDNSVPPNSKDVQHILDIMDDYHEKSGPIVVHCSAGNGRTGTIILLHQYLICLKNKINLSVPALLANIRFQRSDMVANKYQYKYVYDFIESA